MLRYDVTTLARGPLATTADVPAEDPLFQGVGTTLETAVAVRGRLAEAGPGRYYWQAELSVTVATGCRRCLRALHLPVVVPVRVLFAEDVTEDDAAVYPIPPRTRELDVSEAVRQELILALPKYALCAPSCRGLCAGCGADLNVAPCTCRPEPDPRWAVLEALKVGRTPDQR